MAGTPLGYYEWYPRDFYTSIIVRSMSFTARSIYRELLDIQWENGCLTDVQRLLNVMGITVEQWNEFAPFLDELFPNGVNNRLNSLREKAFQNQQNKSKAGQVSAQKRLESNSSSTPVQQTFNETETTTETTTETNKKKRDSSGEKKPPAWAEFAEVELPSSLNSDIGRQTWRDFCKHRAEKRAKLTSTQVAGLLKELSGYPSSVAVGSLRQTINKGWQGVFPEKFDATSAYQEKTKSTEPVLGVDYMINLKTGERIPVSEVDDND
jgi:hypothetical protein